MKKLSEEIAQLEEEKNELEEQLDECRSEKEEVCDEDCGTSKVPFKVGQAYFIRTVTYHCTGKVKRIAGNFLVLKDAAWIADSGRFRQAIVDGILSEIEPVDVDMLVNINSITDAFLWKHKLPRDQK